MSKNDINRPLLVARDGMELGTLPESQVLELLSEGFFRNTDHYWDPDVAEWKTLADLQRDHTGSSHDKTPAWLSQAAETLSVAAGMIGQAAGAVAKNVQSFVSVKKASVEDATHRLLADYLPEIKKLVREQIISRPAAAARSALQNEVFMRNIFGAAHDCLPKPVKRFITESAFVEFCLENKAKIFEDGKSAPENFSPNAE